MQQASPCRRHCPNGLGRFIDVCRLATLTFYSSRGRLIGFAFATARAFAARGFATKNYSRSRSIGYLLNGQLSG